MINIPIGPQSFKRDFLNGQGHFNFDLPGGLKTGEAFTPTVTEVLNTGGSGERGDLTFGDPNGLAMSASVSGGGATKVELIWPQSQSEFGKAYGITVPNGRVSARLHLEGQAGGTLSRRRAGAQRRGQFRVRPEGGQQRRVRPRVRIRRDDDVAGAAPGSGLRARAAAADRHARVAAESGRAVRVFVRRLPRSHGRAHRRLRALRPSGPHAARSVDGRRVRLAPQGVGQRRLQGRRQLRDRVAPGRAIPTACGSR